MQSKIWTSELNSKRNTRSCSTNMYSDEQAEQTFHRKWHAALTQYTPVADKVSNVDKTALNV